MNFQVFYRQNQNFLSNVFGKLFFVGIKSYITIHTVFSVLWHNLMCFWVFFGNDRSKLESTKRTMSDIFAFSLSYDKSQFKTTRCFWGLTLTNVCMYVHFTTYLATYSVTKCVQLFCNSSLSMTVHEDWVRWIHKSNWTRQLSRFTPPLKITWVKYF